MYQPSIMVLGPSLRVTQVTRWRAVRPKNCFRSPVSVVSRSMVMTGRDAESLWYSGGHSNNYVLPQIAPPVGLPAVIEIQNARICGEVILADQGPFEEFGHTAVIGSGDNFPIAVEHGPKHRCEGKQTDNSLHGVPPKTRVAEAAGIAGRSATGVVRTRGGERFKPGLSSVEHAEHLAVKPYARHRYLLSLG
jgi:hypothetical protein